MARRTLGPAARFARLPNRAAEPRPVGAFAGLPQVRGFKAPSPSGINREVYDMKGGEMEAQKPTYDDLAPGSDNGLWLWQGKPPNPPQPPTPTGSRKLQRSLLSVATLLVLGSSISIVERPNDGSSTVAIIERRNHVEAERRDEAPPQNLPVLSPIPAPMPPKSSEIDPAVLTEMRLWSDMILWWQSSPMTKVHATKPPRYHLKHQNHKREESEEFAKQADFGCPPSLASVCGPDVKPQPDIKPQP